MAESMVPRLRRLSNGCTLAGCITWIVGQFNADATLTGLSANRAFMYSAPESVPTPFVIIQKQAGTVDYVMCKQAFSSHFLAIKCVDTGFDGGKRARAVMDRVTQLIELQTPTITDGGYTMTILANNTYEYDEQESGNNNFYHIVINFRIVIGQ